MLGPTQRRDEGVAEFGPLLRFHRQAVRLSQEQLAERAGLSARTVGDLERGRVRAPRPPSLMLLADALGLAGAERELFEHSGREAQWAARLTASDLEAVIAHSEADASDRSSAARHGRRTGQGDAT